MNRNTAEEPMSLPVPAGLSTLVVNQPPALECKYCKSMRSQLLSSIATLKFDNIHLSLRYNHQVAMLALGVSSPRCTSINFDNVQTVGSQSSPFCIDSSGDLLV